MDLINAFSGMQQANLMSQVQMSVARKMLDNQEMMGSMAVQLIQSAGEVAPGDAMVAAATGLGGTVDTYG